MTKSDGLSSVEQHPVVVHDLVVAYAIEQEPPPAAEGEHNGEPGATVDDPAVVADNAVVTIGLPAVRDLVTTQPELAGGEDLATALVVALAHRLTAQQDPYGTALSTALTSHLEEWIAANPDPAGEFYAVFDVHAQVAQQWVEQAVATHAGELPAPAATAGPAGDGTAGEADPGDLSDDLVEDLFGDEEESPSAPTSAPAGTYLMPDLVEQFLRDVPGAEALTPDQINDAIREALAESEGSTP